MSRTVEVQTSLLFMPLEAIKDRGADTRKLNQKHVEALALSIAAIGLIEPLVVDQEGILLAGGHRKAAIALLTNGDQTLLTNLFPDGIPVRVMSFSAMEFPDKALQVEIAENEHRRDYTAKEVKAIAERLKQAGFEELKGRPSKKQKALMPALSAVVGKSTRQLRRIMNDKSRTDDRLLEGRIYLGRAIANLEKWQKVEGATSKELSKQVERMLGELREGMGQF